MFNPMFHITFRQRFVLNRRITVAIITQRSDRMTRSCQVELKSVHLHCHQTTRAWYHSLFLARNKQYFSAFGGYVFLWMARLVLGWWRIRCCLLCWVSSLRDRLQNSMSLVRWWSPNWVSQSLSWIAVSSTYLQAYLGISPKLSVYSCEGLASLWCWLPERAAAARHQHWPHRSLETSRLSLQHPNWDLTLAAQRTIL